MFKLNINALIEKYGYVSKYVLTMHSDIWTFMQKRACKRARFPFPCRPGDGKRALRVRPSKFVRAKRVMGRGSGGGGRNAPRTNTPWGPKMVIFDGFWKPRFCIPYSTFRICVLKIDAFWVWNLNTVQHFSLMQVKKCRKVFIFMVEFEYSTWFFAYGSPKVP